MKNNEYKLAIRHYIHNICDSLIWLTNKKGLLITLFWIISMLHALTIIDILQFLVIKSDINHFINFLINKIPRISIEIPVPDLFTHIYNNIINKINFDSILIYIVLIILWVFSGTKQKYLEDFYKINIKNTVDKIKKYFENLLLILIGDFLYKQILAALYSVWMSQLGTIIYLLNGLAFFNILDSSKPIPSFLGVDGNLARILWLILLILVNLIVGKFIQHWSYIYRSPSARLNIIVFIIIISIYLAVDEYTRIRFIFLVILINLILIIYGSGRMKMTKEAEKKIGDVFIRETITPNDVLYINREGDVLGDLTVNIEIIIKENKKAHLDLVFLLDKSASMCNADRQKMRKQAILDFVSKLDANHRVSIIYFDKDVDVRTKLTHDLNLVKKEIENMPNDNGGTDYDRAFSKAIEIMDDDNQKITGYLINKEIELMDDNREAAASLSIKDVEIRDDQKEKAGQLGSKIIIFISDGNSDNDYNCRQETIDECTKKRYKIYPIGICTHQDSKTIFKKMADNTEGLSFFAESGQEFADIFDDLAKMMPYELIGINSKVIKIIPPYFGEIKDLKMIETPYKQIYKNKYDRLENELKTEEDGTKSIFCEIGTLFAYNSKWILSYRAKTSARLPASLILSDSSSKKSVFNYVNEKGNLVEGTLPITEIQFKAEQGLIRKIIDSLAGNKK